MSSRKGVPAMDTLPEYFPYRDDGCDVSPSCLVCPLPQCRYDSDASGNRNWLQQERRTERDSRVLHVRRTERATVVELARRFAISQRTVHRILSRAQDGHSSPPTSSSEVPPEGEPASRGLSVAPEWRPFLQQAAR